jgi:outer membrane protein assembly factor BamC
MPPIAIRFLPGLCVVALLTGCSGTIDQAIDDVLPKREASYKSSRSLPPLEIPPDLSGATLNDTLQVPQGGAAGGAGSATYSQYTSATQQVAAVGNTGVLPNLANARVERSGDKRWLVVDASPAQVWSQVRDFWLAQGFLIEMEDPSIGIMETDWAEQRAPVRGGFIRGMLDKMSNAFYGIATRDKYRTRLERAADGGTEIYVSHRGAEEVIAEAASSLPSADRTRSWQPRASDPELEAEMLTRLMVSFGTEEQAAEQRVAGSEPRRERAQMQRDGGGSVLTLNESFSRAWRRTGLALDRVGFTVEDRDRSRGLYFVRYVDPEKDVKGQQQSGFFSKLAFWRDKTRDTSKDAYLISLIGGRDDSGDTQVVVLNKEGEREASDTADRILSLLHDELR